MKNFLKQFVGLLGTGVAAACCLGIPVVLSALGTLGLGFIVHDAYLFPLFVGFAGFSLWLLYRSAQQHGQMTPFWLALGGGVFGAVGLWFMVTGVFPQPWSVYVGVGVLVAGSVWDFINGRRIAACATDCDVPSETTGSKKPDLRRRAMTGAALSVAAAGAFYGMYKSVDALVPKAEAGEVACWGINECKGTTACTTAFNACTSQNECKGQGYIYVPEKQCYARGGELLAGSDGDPARR